MKKILGLLFFLILCFPGVVFAYTKEDVAKHNTSSDCWMIFEEKVYDITNRVEIHDQYMDIREWCGKDMTSEFKDKDGKGVDHKNSTYALLNSLEIGDLEEKVVAKNEIKEEAVVESGKKMEGYNILFPFLFSVVTYWLSYLLVKKNRLFGITILRFNAFWNTVLFLTLLLPAFGFGLFMIIRTKVPSLYDIDFDFLYWHVELSLVMGFLAINHFLNRFVIYTKQLGIK